MKTSVLTAIFILVHTGLCFGQEQIEANLSRFIYSIPVMEGMQQQGNADQVKYAIGKGIDVGVVTKVFHSKEGRHISAEEICQFYYDHFTSLEFRAWQEPANLSGRYMAPRIAINKDALSFAGTYQFLDTEGRQFSHIFHAAAKRLQYPEKPAALGYD